MSLKDETMQKAVKQLQSIDVPASIETETVYVHIGETMLELSWSEIEFQSMRYDERLKEENN